MKLDEVFAHDFMQKIGRLIDIWKYDKLNFM